MAKKRKKKKKSHRKNPKRVAAGRRAYRNNPNPFGRSKGRRHGKRKKGHGKRKKSHSGRGKSHGHRGMTMQQKLTVRRLTAKLVARGYTKKEAESKIRHLVTTASKRVSEAKERAAQKAANQTALANMFAGFGMAGKAAQVMH